MPRYGNKNERSLDSFGKGRLVLPVLLIAFPLSLAGAVRYLAARHPVAKKTARAYVMDDASPATSSDSMGGLARYFTEGSASELKVAPSRQAPSAAARGAPPNGGGADVSDFAVEYQAAFSTLPSDWSAGKLAREAANAIRGNAPAGVQLNSVECRSSMCRFEVEMNDQQAFVDWVYRASNLDAADFSSRTYTQRTTPPGDPTAPFTCVSYVARAGHDLPEVN